MPQPQSTTEATPPSCPAEAARRARVRRRRRVIGYAILAILILPPLADVLSDPYGEVADWYYAAALEEYESGNREQAEAHLASALRWSPATPRVAFARAQWAVEEQRYEDALTEIDKAIQAQGETVPLLMQRSEIYQHLGRYKAAVADWEAILQQTDQPTLLERLYPAAYRQRRANVLNAVAYAQSLGKIKLPIALERISESLELSDERGMTAEKLDTRGYVHYLLGNYKLALSDLNEAVEEMDAYRRALQNNQAELRRARADGSSVDLAIDSADRGLAVMLYHRALVFEQLGQQKQARADLDRVRQITGREPGEWLF